MPVQSDGCNELNHKKCCKHVEKKEVTFENGGDNCERLGTLFNDSTNSNGSHENHEAICYTKSEENDCPEEVPLQANCSIAINQSSSRAFGHHRVSFDDRVDAIPKEMSFTLLDAAAILFSIGSFLFDIGTDIAVSAFHFLNNDMWYFGLTVAFVFIPTLIMTGISMRWYVLDAREEGSPSISKFQWVMRFIFLLFQLGPILRYYDSLMYGLKFRQHKDKEAQKKYFQYMVYEGKFCFIFVSN